MQWRLVGGAIDYRLIVKAEWNLWNSIKHMETMFDFVTYNPFQPLQGAHPSLAPPTSLHSSHVTLSQKCPSMAPV